MYTDSGNLQNFYTALRKVYAQSDQSLAPVRSQDGSTLFTNKSEIMDRLKGHYSTLLNVRYPSNPLFLGNAQQLAIITEINSAPTKHEVAQAVSSMKNKKSPGMDRIPAELLKHDGESVRNFGRRNFIIRNFCRKNFRRRSFRQKNFH